MDIAEERKRLIEQLSNTEDIDIIQKVKDVLNTSNESEVIGYNADGSKITKSQLVKRAQIANQSIKDGKTKSIDQVREEMKKW
ncbi:hypothetical protein MATR_09470 [Marivirga tractuosa]|uniref:Uncharacterized protein n=1 Tax=Marivirga tractuosa (strain ATCC 23168 / DSM 4126 / NBRC 15989 / NCIMB 1408 / VKM B-1430 / H-43) TaxID=643867 RepID=E4TMZ3_MARTH|nr:hypothetical protein [Marivirga tractuosa]ADR21424.1 hypothetical protein Ftrac_1434 [Marivirga tractuosa DSM 4126]BDD14122.1 hypothetical protein MATR_09470 [Marivirga tractuosa]